VVVLADHTKVGVEAMTQTVPTAAIDRLITDDRSDPGELRRLEAAGVAVTVCRVDRSPG
jgi:DeoR/GlpR family transcriptional regulator of sugar metabolism